MNIKKYGRNWAVYDSYDNLICLTVYKKGAKEVFRRLSAIITDEFPETQIYHDKITNLSKELKTVNRKFNQLIEEMKAIENTQYKGVFYNQNHKNKEEDYLCQQK